MKKILSYAPVQDKRSRVKQIDDRISKPNIQYGPPPKTYNNSRKNTENLKINKGKQMIDLILGSIDPNDTIEKAISEVEGRLDFFFSFPEIDNSEESLKFYSLLAIALSDIKKLKSNKNTNIFIVFIENRFQQLSILHKNVPSIDLKPLVPKKYYYSEQ